MRIVVLDTETTGLGDSAEVIQLSSICVDEEFVIKGASNAYCKVTIPVPPDATAIHGITNEVLEELSDNKFIEDHIESLDYLVNPTDTIFVGYNISYDIARINHSLTNAGYEPIDFGTNVNVIPRETNGKNYNICLMRTLKDNIGYRGRWKKLSDVCSNYLEQPMEVVNGIRNVIVNEFKLCPGHGNDNYHDALFDTLVTLLLFRQYIGYYRL